jgi:hypothetical protein
MDAVATPLVGADVLVAATERGRELGGGQLHGGPPAPRVVAFQTHPRDFVARQVKQSVKEGVLRADTSAVRLFGGCQSDGHGFILTCGAL